MRHPDSPISPASGGFRPCSKKVRTMLKKIMLAGLMSVTALAGISPAYAQAGQDRGSRGERAARGDGNVVV